MNKQQFHRLYRILTGISIATTSLCLVVACGFLYISDGGFSRETVAQTFHTIAFPVYLSLGLLALYPLTGLSPLSNTKRQRFLRQEWLILCRLRKRTDLTLCNTVLREKILTERRMQRIQRSISAGLAGISCIILTVYLLSGDRFPRETPNTAILGFLWILTPCLILNWVWFLVSGPKYAKSCQREIDLLKALPPSAQTPEGNDGYRLFPTLRILVLAAAVFLLILGISAGGAADVLTKAINICTECIGLG